MLHGKISSIFLVLLKIKNPYLISSSNNHTASKTSFPNR